MKQHKVLKPVFAISYYLPIIKISEVTFYVFLSGAKDKCNQI